MFRTAAEMCRVDVVVGKVGMITSLLCTGCRTIAAARDCRSRGHAHAAERLICRLPASRLRTGFPGKDVELRSFTFGHPEVR